MGSVVEGVGNAPAVQKLGGKEEEKGYLGTIYDTAAGAVRTVYDAAGNVVCYIRRCPNVYCADYEDRLALSVKRQGPTYMAQGTQRQRVKKMRRPKTKQ